MKQEQDIDIADSQAVNVDAVVMQRPTGRADKYSLNLYKWIRKHGEHYRGAYFSPWSNVDGSMIDSTEARTSPSHIYIGFLDDDGYLTGSRLSEIITQGCKANTWAFAPKLAFIELPDFWAQYVKLGKCAFDPDHWLYLNKERYEITGDNKRRCIWCGREEILHVFSVTVQRQEWRRAA